MYKVCLLLEIPFRKLKQSGKALQDQTQCHMVKILSLVTRNTHAKYLSSTYYVAMQELWQLRIVLVNGQIDGQRE